LNLNTKKNVCLNAVVLFCTNHPEYFYDNFNNSIVQKYLLNFLNSVNILEYYEKYKKVLPIKKVALIHRAEMMYKKSLLDKMRGRRDD